MPYEHIKNVSDITTPDVFFSRRSPSPHRSFPSPGYPVLMSRIGSGPSKHVYAPILPPSRVYDSTPIPSPPQFHDIVHPCNVQVPGSPLHQRTATTPPPPPRSSPPLQVTRTVGVASPLPPTHLRSSINNDVPMSKERPTCLDDLDQGMNVFLYISVVPGYRNNFRY